MARWDASSTLPFCAQAGAEKPASAKVAAAMAAADRMESTPRVIRNLLVISTQHRSRARAPQPRPAACTWTHDRPRLSTDSFRAWPPGLRRAEGGVMAGVVEGKLA